MKSFLMRKVSTALQKFFHYKYSQISIFSLAGCSSDRKENVGSVEESV